MDHLRLTRAPRRETIGSPAHPGRPVPLIHPAGRPGPPRRMNVIPFSARQMIALALFGAALVATSVLIARAKRPPKNKKPATPPAPAWINLK